MKCIENKKVGDVMTPNVVTVSTDDSARRVAKILNEKKISCVGVKDSDGNVVGTVSETDIIKAFDKDPKEVTSKDIMTPSVEFINPESTLKEAMGILSEKGIHRLLVISDKKPVGILSTSDIVKTIKTTLKEPTSKAYVSKFEFGALYPEKREIIDVRDKRIEGVMTVGVIYVPLDSTVREVSWILAEKNIHGVVVTTEDSEMLGIVSSMDIIKAVDRNLDELIAGDVMSSPIKTIDQCRRLSDATEIMEEHHIHRLLVLFEEPCTGAPAPFRKRPIMTYKLIHGITDSVSIPMGILSTSDIVREIAGSE